MHRRRSRRIAPSAVRSSPTRSRRMAGIGWCGCTARPAGKTPRVGCRSVRSGSPSAARAGKGWPGLQRCRAAGGAHRGVAGTGAHQCIVVGQSPAAQLGSDRDLSPARRDRGLVPRLEVERAAPGSQPGARSSASGASGGGAGTCDADHARGGRAGGGRRTPLPCPLPPTPITEWPPERGHAGS